MKERGSGLEGQVAVVTGAAQGLGLGIVEKLGQYGANVINGDLQYEKAGAAAAALSARGMAVEAAELDVADSGAVTRFFNRISEERGHVDILVNNAGVGQKVAPVVELSDEEWQRVIHITLTGTFYCCRAAGRIMEGQGRGSVVNIASINGQNPAATERGKEIVLANEIRKGGDHLVLRGKNGRPAWIDVQGHICPICGN